jgi:hypothetical protein
MLIKYKINNNFTTNYTGSTVTVNGEEELLTQSKFLTLPVNLSFSPVDYGDDINILKLKEREKSLNNVFDGETIKYVFRNNTSNNNRGLLIKFRFWDIFTSSYSFSYNPAGFTQQEIDKKRNPFKKSFFRLYFYDSNSGDTNNLIFTEDLDVFETETPIMSLNRLYWLRDDVFFRNGNTNRTIYMDARFFNAKNGKISRFINIPLSVNSLININQYNNLSNRDWRHSAIEILNPKLNNGEYNFRPLIPYGANTTDTITLTEFIMN